MGNSSALVETAEENNCINIYKGGDLKKISTNFKNFEFYFHTNVLIYARGKSSDSFPCYTSCVYTYAKKDKSL